MLRERQRNVAVAAAVESEVVAAEVQPAERSSLLVEPLVELGGATAGFVEEPVVVVERAKSVSSEDDRSIKTMSSSFGKAGINFR